jgi:hypothetical protein
MSGLVVEDAIKRFLRAAAARHKLKQRRLPSVGSVAERGLSGAPKGSEEPKPIAARLAAIALTRPEERIRLGEIESVV